MAVTVSSAKFDMKLETTIASGTGATHVFTRQFLDILTDSAGAYLFDRVFDLGGTNGYSLTTGAGNLDLDLYDLASVDVGAGAGQDNLGLSHANARIIAMAVRNREVTSGGTLRIDNNGATNPWVGIFGATRVLDLAQGAMFFTYLGESGKTVTDASDHICRLSAQTNNCTIDFVFFSKQS